MNTSAPARFIRRSVLPVLAAGALAVCSSSFAQLTYQIDDGTAENSIGLQNGDIIWLNQFTVTGGNNIITSISVAFASPGGTNAALLNGLPFTVFLWSDPNSDGSPADAVVLTSAMGTVAGSGTNTFVTVNIPATAVMGSSFFVGAMMQNTPTSTFPAALDTQAPTFTGRSWVAGGAGGTGNPNNLPANGLFGTIDSFGFPGNWLVRAEAVPEPSTYALLVGGAAFAGFIARRRKKS